MTYKHNPKVSIVNTLVIQENWVSYILILLQNHPAKSAVGQHFYNHEHALFIVNLHFILDEFDSTEYDNNVSTFKYSRLRWQSGQITCPSPLKSRVRFSVRISRTQSSCEKSISQRSAESRGFSPGTPVSSHKESWQWPCPCGGSNKKIIENFRILHITNSCSCTSSFLLLSLVAWKSIFQVPFIQFKQWTQSWQEAEASVLIYTPTLHITFVTCRGSSDRGLRLMMSSWLANLYIRPLYIVITVVSLVMICNKIEIYTFHPSHSFSFKWMFLDPKLSAMFVTRMHA